MREIVVHEIVTNRLLHPLTSKENYVRNLLMTKIPYRFRLLLSACLYKAFALFGLWIDETIDVNQKSCLISLGEHDLGHKQYFLLDTIDILLAYTRKELYLSGKCNV